MKINYKIHKNKNDLYLVFLHGLGGNLYAWNEIRTIMHKKNYSTLAIDLRGHGESFRPKKINDYKLEYFADDINKIIKKEKIKKFVIIGHCFGGVIASIYQNKYKKAKGAILIASTYKSPKRLKAIIPVLGLFNYFLSNYLPDKNLYNRKSFDDFINTGDYNPKRIFTDILNTSPKSYSATFYQFNKYNGEKILPKINIPVLIISGENDTIFNLKYAEKIAKLIKKSKLEIIEHTNHILIINYPQKITKLIIKFLNGLLKK